MDKDFIDKIIPTTKEMNRGCLMITVLIFGIGVLIGCAIVVIINMVKVHE